jgi:hypothetical protein
VLGRSVLLFSSWPEVRIREPFERLSVFIVVVPIGNIGYVTDR